MRAQVGIESIVRYSFAFLLITATLSILWGAGAFNSGAWATSSAEFEDFFVEDFSMSTNGTLKLILLSKIDDRLKLENFAVVEGVNKPILADDYILTQNKKLEINILNATDNIELNQQYQLNLVLQYYRQRSQLRHLSNGRVRGFVSTRSDFDYTQNGTLFLNGSFERTILDDNKVKLDTVPHAITVYYDFLNPNASRFRIWNGVYWNEEDTTNNVDGWVNYQTLLETSPNQREFIMGNVDDLRDLNLQIWNGSWNSPIEVSNNTAISTMRNFDIKYEQLSGRAIVVYKRWSGTTDMAYRIWDGTNWSGETQYTFGGSASPRLVKMIEKPDSNKIMCLVADNNRDLFAKEWDGNNWGAETLIETDLCSSMSGRYCFDFEYNYGGHGIIAYQKNNSLMPYYRIWNGSWGTEQMTNNIGNTSQWITLASDFASEETIMVTLDAANDLNAQIWNGSEWSAAFELNATIETYSQKSFDATYYAPGHAIVVYGYSGRNWPNYRIWNGSWGIQQGALDVGGDQSWIKLTKNNFNNKILLSVLENEGFDYSVQEWNGFSWGNYYELETESNRTYLNFDTKYEKIIIGSYAAIKSFEDLVEINELIVNGNGILKYRLSNDSITWAEWTNYVISPITINKMAKYINYNITMNSSNQTMPTINSIKIKYKK